MKVIPRKDLIVLVEKKVESELLTKDVFDYLFETYGDDWFISDTDHTQYSLFNKNKEREKIVGSK